VLFLLFGASSAGKTTLLDGLRRRRLPRLVVHDHDEIGVPPAPDTAWRQRTTEDWLRRVLDYEARGVDVVLAGQTPFAELFAEPSAPLLAGAAGCLVDCDDDTRLRRLRERRAVEPWWRTTPYSLDDYLAWAELMRRHVDDPQHGLWVVQENAWPEMQWDRLVGLSTDDPRWRTHTIDTTKAPPEESTADLVAWIERERASP
jgi:hypothetical protein